MKYRGFCKAWALALTLSLAAGAAAAAEPLRFCADPDNLPFSKAEGPERGMYVEVAELVAQKLGMPVEFTWWYTHNQRRALRNTVGKDASCDIVVALPADYSARALVKTKPFMSVSYAVVAAPEFSFKRLDDLRASRIGVQFGSTPQIVLATIDGFRTTTYRESDEMFAALAKKEIDIAFLWGPSAGYDNKRRHGERWRVTPVAGHDFAGEVAMAVRREKESLLPQINAALADLKPQIERLADKYGFPRTKPVDLAVAGGAVRVASHLVVPVADPAKGNEAAVKAGRVRFNDQCSHCHGQDGFSPVRERDLRRLTGRYDAKWPEVALATIKNGRSDVGMPAWKDILKDGEVQELMAFLKTIQK
jgi:polar amino acid transport system substrate-binding protein